MRSQTSPCSAFVLKCSSDLPVPLHLPGWTVLEEHGSTPQPGKSPLDGRKDLRRCVRCGFQSYIRKVGCVVFGCVAYYMNKPVEKRQSPWKRGRGESTSVYTPQEWYQKMSWVEEKAIRSSLQEPDSDSESEKGDASAASASKPDVPVIGCRLDRPPHRWLPSGNTGRAPWRKHVRPSGHTWTLAAERLWSTSVTDLDPGCRLTCPQMTCFRILWGSGHPLQHCRRLPRQVSSWCQDVCCSCSKAMSGCPSRCRQGERRWLSSTTRRGVPYHRPLAQETDFRPHNCSFATCMQEQPPTNAAEVATCLGPPRGTQGAISAPQRSALCQDLPFERICSMLLAGHGSRWSAPRELPRQQCSALSHFGRAHGEEAGANDEACLGRRRCLSRTHPLTRLHTITCLDSWVRRMAQITGRKPGAAHRPLVRA